MSELAHRIAEQICLFFGMRNAEPHPDEVVLFIAPLEAELETSKAECERLKEPCQLVHCPCSSCGVAIREDGHCNCPDNCEHPTATTQRDERSRLLIEVARLRKCETADIPAIEELEAELRECAMATGWTTGNEAKDTESLVVPVTCLPLETADLVRGRIMDRDIQIALIEADNKRLTKLLALTENKRKQHFDDNAVLKAENERLNKLVDSTECACSKEEAAHSETLRLLESRDVEIAELQQQVETLRKDADRYRWLVGNVDRAIPDTLGRSIIFIPPILSEHSEIDAAIDASLSEHPKET